MVEKPKPDYQIDVYVDGCWLDGVNHPSLNFFEVT